MKKTLLLLTALLVIASVSTSSALTVQEVSAAAQKFQACTEQAQNDGMNLKQAMISCSSDKGSMSLLLNRSN